MPQFQDEPKWACSLWAAWKLSENDKLMKRVISALRGKVDRAFYQLFTGGLLGQGKGYSSVKL